MPTHDNYPQNVSPSDAKARDIVSQASVIPVTKEIFPNYKTRSILRIANSDFGMDSQGLSRNRSTKRIV